ncbi:MAG TPA: hypothetical protein VFB06_33300 [Streptosporangiaceae bacterium]|nr:hypothetical protein [Streptosporangiaceae bacterium]
MVHKESHGGRAAGLAASRVSRALPGTSCSQACGQALGTNASPSEARLVPCSGEPSVMTSRALAAPS